MSSYARLRSSHGFARVFFAAALLLCLCALPQIGAHPVSRRQAMREFIAKAKVDFSKEYRIGVKHMPPMCFYDPSLPEDERFSGFYIDFWRQMNEELNLNYSLHIFSNNLDVIDALKDNEIDIGLGLSITWKRALEVEFTQPIVDGSLRIMTKYGSGLVNVWEMFMPFNWTLWVAILVVGIINGHIIWWVERDSNTYYFPKFYFSGVREGLWFSFMNLMMMDDAVVRSLPGKIVKFGSTFIGVILIAIYTANVASVLTTGDINNRILGPSDLIGTKVGSNYGSTAADYVAGYGGMQLTLYPTSQDAFLALKHNKIPAIILDYPVLVYYSRLYPTPGLAIIDNILEYDLIGLAMRQNSSLIPTLNGVIVGLTQTGYSSQLSDKWVGQPKRAVTTSYDFFDTAGLWIWMAFWIIIGGAAFLLKKYVVKKRYKQSSWYESLGGVHEADEKDAGSADKPLLTKQRSPLAQSLSTYSDGEETDSDVSSPTKLSKSINADVEDGENSDSPL